EPVAPRTDTLRMLRIRTSGHVTRGVATPPPQPPICRRKHNIGTHQRPRPSLIFAFSTCNAFQRKYRK
ncbi:hypothetical protein IscW_ISCW018850, partial [Ixodes scapularis]